MKNALRLCLLTLIAMVGLTGAALAEKRVALVIGNGAYTNAPPLPNPPRDAHAIADKLKAMGFDVVEGYDLDKMALNSTIQKFARAVNGADVGLFYYAGHGMQMNNENYIVPVDAKLEDQLSVDFEITKISFVIDQMSRDVKLKIALLDACRDNPLSRSLAAKSRAIAVTGLAKLDVVNQRKTDGSLIAFATDPGNVALDGKGDHSPFTQALLENIDSTASLSSVMNRVTSDVLKITENQQRPWVQASLTDDVFLNPAVASDAQPAQLVAPTTLTQTPAPASGASLDREKALWAAVQQSNTAEDYRAYLQQYPNGLYARLAANALERVKVASLTPATDTAAPAVGPSPAPPAVAQAPSSVETEAALDLDTPKQKLVQKRLKLAGFDPGKVNGDFGAKTRIAIGQWQTARGIPATNYLNFLQYDFLLAQTGGAEDVIVAAPERARPYVAPRVRPAVQRPARVVRRYDRGGRGGGSAAGGAFIGAFGGAILGGIMRHRF